MIQFEFFDTLDHDFVCGTKAVTNFNVKSEFSLIGTIIRREFEVTDRAGYEELINSAFQDFILTLSSLLENLVRLKEILVRKVIVNSKPGEERLGIATMHLFRDFLQILVDLDYRKQDNFYNCLSPHFQFFDRYLMILFKLRGSIIHGYTMNLEIVPNGGCFVRAADKSFQQQSAVLLADQFVNQVYANVEKLTTDLLNYFIQEVSVTTAKIPL